MKNIVMARVDDRLIHGQVVLAWIPFLKVNEVVVIDDEAAEDDFLKEMISASAPENVKINIMDLEEGTEYLQLNGDKEKILIITKNIYDIKVIAEKNIKINKLNLGNLGLSEGRKRITGSLSMNKEEITLAKEIENMGINVEIQMIPAEKAQKLKDLV